MVLTPCPYDPINVEQEQKRDLLLSSKAVLIVGREKVKKGPQKGQFIEVVKRSIKIQDISHLSLSSKQDGFIVIHVPKEYDSLLEIVFKTEFLTLLSTKYKDLTSQELQIKISDKIDFQVKKEGWGGGTCTPSSPIFRRLSHILCL